MLKKNINLIILIYLFYIFFNFTSLFSDTHNLEWVFIELGKYYKDKAYYFDFIKFENYQANTFFYSKLLSFIIHDFLFNYDYVAFLRLINFIFLSSLFYLILKNDDSDYKLSLIFLIFIFNPIFNTYMFRIYPDVLSIISAFFSLILLQKSSKIKKIFSIILVAISFLLKPISIILSPIFLYAIFNKGENRNKFILLVFFSLSIFLSLLILIFFQEKIITGSINSAYLKFDYKQSIYNFFSYLNYISLILLPLTIYYLINSNLKTNFFFYLLSIINFFVIKNFYNDMGEMNYGFLSIIFDKILFFDEIILITNCVLTSILLIKLLDRKNDRTIFYLCLISIFMLSILIYRPAQRYILYILPFIIYYAFYKSEFVKIKKFNYVFFSFIIYFSILNTGLKFNQFLNNKAYSNIIVFLEKENILKETDPGILFHSKGYLFKDYILNKNFKQLKYVVDVCNLNPRVYVYKVKIFEYTLKKICINLL